MAAKCRCSNDHLFRCQSAAAVLKRKLKGKICWGPFFSPLVNLSFEFGKPSLVLVHEPPAHHSGEELNPDSFTHRRVVHVGGQYTLWLTGARWAIRSAGEGVAAKDYSSQRVISRAIMWLAGQRVTDVFVDQDDCTMKISMDLGGSIVIRLAHLLKGGEDVWVLYGPGDEILSLLPNGTLRTGEGERAARSGQVHGATATHDQQTRRGRPSHRPVARSHKNENK
jgi:hypothetical protein